MFLEPESDLPLHRFSFATEGHRENFHRDSSKKTRFFDRIPSQAQLCPILSEAFKPNGIKSL